MKKDQAPVRRRPNLFDWRAIALLCVLASLPGCIYLGAGKATIHIGEGPPGNPWLGSVRHVVLFAFKPGTPPETRRAVEQAARRLPEEIALIRAFEWGTELSEPSRAQGFTHCMLMTFDSMDALGDYLPHPAHERFRQLALPHIDKLLVIDYRAQE